MKFAKDNSQIYVYNEISTEESFHKTTHLAIAAHQDDVEFMAYHGVAKCFGQKDKGFGAVIVSNGSGSPRSGIYANYTDEEMIEIRIREQKKAAFVGEYSFLAMLMYSSQEIKNGNNNKVINDLYNILISTKPEVVYTHNLADKHDTHVGVVVKTIKAIRMMPSSDRPKIVYGCEVWRALDWLSDEDKVLLDVSGRLNIAQAIMGVFDSQISGGKNYANATIGRRISNATYAQDHEIDAYSHLSYAMDLSPLIKDNNLKLDSFVAKYIEDFLLDVKKRLERVS